MTSGRRDVQPDPEPAPPAPVVPIVVVHHRAPEWCAASVASLRASTGVVADVRIIDNSTQNRGFAGGANLGVRQALAEGAPYVFVASHDVSVGPTTLATMVAALGRHHDAGIVGVRASTTFASHDLVAVEPGISRRSWVSGTLVLLRAACLEQIGLFDERFGSYVEDVDLCYRARDRGWLVLCCDDAEAGSRGSSDPRKAAAMVRANYALLTTKRSGPVAGARSVLVLVRVAAAGVLRGDGRAGRRWHDPRVAAVRRAIWRYPRFALRPQRAEVPRPAP